MNSSRLMSSRYLVFLTIGVSGFTMLMYFHLVTEVTHLRNVMHSHAALGSILRGVPPVDNVLDLDNLVIIYNRVPKTGSTSFIGLAYDLCAKNKFNVLHINTTKNMPTLSLTDQMRFVYNVSNWLEKKPGIYHGHIAYLDFNSFECDQLISSGCSRLYAHIHEYQRVLLRFGVSRQPLYINIIRKPLDRLVSYYYFIRYGDDLRPYLIRKKMGDKMTLDECVALEHADCSVNHVWLQVPFFCGHHSDCWIPGSNWALEQAKFNLVHNYFLVGVTEELKDFVALLEYSLPRFFKGALHLYNTGQRSHLRKTVKKILPSEETIAKLQNTKVMRLEEEFYNFALNHFHYLRKKTLVDVEGSDLILDRGQNFGYEKIKPRKSAPEAS